MSGGMGGNRLAVLADEAKGALSRIVQGEESTIGGWLAYGHALNEGRALFPDDDKGFGQWIQDNLLCQLDTVDGPKDVDRHDRAAAMWADANPVEFEEARQRGNPRTIRGIHAKWKEIEAERVEEQRREDAEAQRANAPEAVASADTGPDQRQDEPDSDQDVIDAAPEPEPDPNAKERAEFRKLSAEGQEDDWIGLRAENSDLRKRVQKQTNMIADLKSQIKTLTEGDDNGKKIGSLMRRLDQSEGRSKEHQANAARLQKQVNAQAAEIKKHRAERERQEVPLN